MCLSTLRSIYSQSFPPPAAFTEKNVPSRSGRVFIVTGGNAGIGFELCKLLYATGATVYMASRSKDRAEAAIKSITESSPQPETPSTLKFLHLDLNDLDSVKEAAATFAQQESKLDILWNNAGTGANLVQVGAKTAQGFEAMVGMHCIATLLFTELLLPQLRAAVAAALEYPGSVRVVWTSSFLAEGGTPKYGIDFKRLDQGTTGRVRNYAVSKAGTWMLGREMAQRYGKDGIISVIQNPGFLKSGAYGGTPAINMLLMNGLLRDPKFGAYTELYAAFSRDITLENNGAYIIPWGRIRSDNDCPRKDIIKAMTPVEQGGLGYHTKFWEWCEQKYKLFVHSAS
ncbi:uncharacterized protein CIMG_02499 [Coccidioides immitis RS]|uniref:Short-chain dehydrogenase n=4 Tax=Coccidioides immitis TaxID=5501 RepID=J3KLI3_COCIM|nr:uncharacterized protein CIMG_02499 [Coccidioides immitis RS]EAS37145.3 hypothetical protein CIMG_02499 [Coccidioides immitis RS]KMP10090.1 short chain dehydrogenase [Coccidioides immitis RMSCC 2394]KMU80105.1 short chain dehydrogenase [Coccidioides immitis RMSCC 3703]KMU86601.1 short chain dehydrogenase [Coccidioides immitis H538.4]